MYKKEVPFFLEMTVKDRKKTSGCLRPRGHKRAHTHHGIPGWLWLCLAIMAKSPDRFRVLLFLVVTYDYISELPLFIER